MREAYENKELGFQKGAKSCLYYDSETDSCCAVGVLIKDESLFDANGDQVVPFNLNDGGPIGGSMLDLEMKEYK